MYNRRFSRSRKGQRHSYSVPLIPDIALSVPDGPNAVLHLFDAKFRVFGVPGNGGRDGGRVVSSAEGLPGELEGVGAIPLGPGVGGEGGHGRGIAAVGDNALQSTLGRMLRAHSLKRSE